MICLYSHLLGFVMLHLFILQVSSKQDCVESIADPPLFTQNY